MDPTRKPANRPPHCDLSIRLLNQSKLLARRIDEGVPDAALYIAQAILRQVDDWAKGRRTNGTSTDQIFK